MSGTFSSVVDIELKYRNFFTGIESIVVVVVPSEHLHRWPIGFARIEQAAANGERLTVNVRSKTKTCQHCGRHFEKKHWIARYCSDTCRVEAWEKRTGGKVRKRANKRLLQEVCQVKANKNTFNLSTYGKIRKV